MNAENNEYIDVKYIASWSGEGFIYLPNLWICDLESLMQKSH